MTKAKRRLFSPPISQTSPPNRGDWFSPKSRVPRVSHRLRLRHNGHGGGGGVDSAHLLRGGHSLDAVDAALVLQLHPRALALDVERGLLTVKKDVEGRYEGCVLNKSKACSPNWMSNWNLDTMTF